MADSQSERVITVSLIFGIITIVVLCLRLYARVVILKKMGSDDVLICVAAALSWAFIISTILATQHGMGQHLGTVFKMGSDNLHSYAQIIWFSSIFYNSCIGFIKASVLALYLRLGDPDLRRLAQILLVVVTIQATANVLTCIFECWPIEAAYNVELRITAKCIHINAFYLINAALSITTDLLTYILPVNLVFKLNLPRNQRIGLGVMLCLGLFACIASIVRITYIPRMLQSEDQTFAITGAMYWSVIEINVGIMASSFPSFKSLAKRYAPRLIGSNIQSHLPPSFQMRNGRSDFNPLPSPIGRQSPLDTIDRYLGMSKFEGETTVNQTFDGVLSCEEGMASVATNGGSFATTPRLNEALQTVHDDRRIPPSERAAFHRTTS